MGTATADEVAAPLRRLVHRTRAMGGRLEIHLDAPATGAAAAEREMRQVAARVRAWSAVLSRHDPASQLMRLNGDPRSRVAVGPTLAAALRWALEAEELTGGVVDASLLDERLRAERETGTRPLVAGLTAPTPAAERPVTTPLGDARRWGLSAEDHAAGEFATGDSSSANSATGDPPSDGRRRSLVVSRAPGVRLDLGGVAKGWLADRALAMLRAPGALVDADGDIAVRPAARTSWQIGIGDPRDDETLLGILALPAGLLGRRSYGVATSGTSVHRWGSAGEARHHLIDPATGRPARSDVVQATVVAWTAREAEAYAKTVVIRGGAVGLDLVDRANVLGAVVLLDDGRTVALPRTERFLA